MQPDDLNVYADLADRNGDPETATMLRELAQFRSEPGPGPGGFAEHYGVTGNKSEVERGEVPITPADHRQMVKEATAEVEANPVYGHMAQARNAGLNLANFSKDYDLNSRKDIPGYQKMFTKAGKTSPDGFAQELGYDSLDHMIETFKNTPTKKEAINKAVEGKVEEWANANQAAAKENSDIAPVKNGRVNKLKTFEPKDVSIEPLPDDISDKFPVGGGGRYFHATSAELQSWLSRNGDGHLYRATRPISIRDGLDRGNPKYLHQFPTFDAKVFSFTSSLKNAKEIARENSDSILYRVSPDSLSDEFTIQVFDGEGGIIHVQSPYAAEIPEETIRVGRNSNREGVDSSGSVLRGESANTGTANGADGQELRRATGRDDVREGSVTPQEFVDSLPKEQRSRLRLEIAAELRSSYPDATKLVRLQKLVYRETTNSPPVLSTWNDKTTATTPPGATDKASPSVTTGGVSKEPWQMTLASFVEQQLVNDEYRAAIEADPQEKASFINDQKQEWRRSVEKAAEKGRIPTAVLDDYYAEWGSQVFHSTFRGVAEEGIKGWQPKDVRIWDRTYRQYLKMNELGATKGDQRELHREAIKRAIAEGEDVPAKVLADYPELFQSPTPQKDQGEEGPLFSTGGSVQFPETNRLSNIAREGPVWAAIKRENPQVEGGEEVSIYRATIGDNIRGSDFVAINPDIAAQHLENLNDRGEKGKIITKKVPLSDLVMANDATEFVYSPKGGAILSKSPQPTGNTIAKVKLELSAILPPEVLGNKERLEVVQSQGQLPGHIGRFLKSHLFSPVDRVGDTAQVKSLPDAVVADTKALGDFVNTQAFIEKGFGGFDVPTQKVQLGRMGRLVKNLEIRNLVVESLPVDVVDMLSGKQLTPEMLLHDDAVFADLFSVNGDNSIPFLIDTADSLADIIASSAAKVAEPLASDVGGRSFETDSAMGTNQSGAPLSASYRAVEVLGFGRSRRADRLSGSASGTSNARHGNSSVGVGRGSIAQTGANATGNIFSDEDVSIQAIYSKDGSIAGAFDPKTKKIWLVADTIKPGEAVGVATHEIGHRLMREDEVFIKRYDSLLSEFEALRGSDRRVETAFSRVPSDTPEHLRAEEGLMYAVQAEANVKPGKGLGERARFILKKMAAHIRAWLNTHGFKMKLTHDDIMAMIQQGIKRDIKRSMPGQSEDVRGMAGEPALAAESNVELKAVDTESPEFLAWFGSSKVVDSTGNPLRVFHGTGDDFTDFSSEKLGENTGAQSARKGFFFSNSPRNADRYAVYTSNALMRRENLIPPREI